MTRYECNGDGNCEGDPWFPVAGHRLDSWQYHATGKVMLHEFEMSLEIEGDIFAPSGQYQYDANGNLTRHEEGGGLTETWQYDADGNLTRYEREDNEDVTITYRYEATGWGHLFSEAKMYGHISSPPLKPRP